MFDFTQTIEEQRCQPPGQNMSTDVVRHSDGSLSMAPGAGPPTNWTELQVMLSGGHRNRITQPVRIRLVTSSFVIVRSSQLRSRIADCVQKSAAWTCMQWGKAVVSQQAFERLYRQSIREDGLLV